MLRSMVAVPMPVAFDGGHTHTVAASDMPPASRVRSAFIEKQRLEMGELKKEIERQKELVLKQHETNRLQRNASLEMDKARQAAEAAKEVMQTEVQLLRSELKRAQEQGAQAATAAAEERHRRDMEETRAELAWSREGLQEMLGEKERLQARVRRLEAKLRATSEQLVIHLGDHLAS